MAVSTGNFSIVGAAVGGVQAKALALGATTVWQQAEPVPPVATKAMKLTALQPNSTVVLSATGAPGGQYVYSTNGYDFQSYTLGDSITLANEGDSVWFKAAQSNRGNTYQKYVGFNGSGLVAADGWPEAMTEPDEANWNIASYDNSYYALFYKCQNLKSLVVRGEFQNASPMHPFGAFARECPVLSSVVFPDILSASGQTTFAYSGDGMFTNAFCKDPQLLKVEFPKLEFAKSIAFWAACEYDQALLSVEFPSMTSAWNDAFFGIFNGMTGVPKVVVLSAFESVPGLLQNSGEGWTTLNGETSVVIPDSLYDQWTTTQYWSNMNVTYVKASEFNPTEPVLTPGIWLYKTDGTVVSADVDTVGANNFSLNTNSWVASQTERNPWNNVSALIDAYPAGQGIASIKGGDWSNFGTMNNFLSCVKVELPSLVSTPSNGHYYFGCPGSPAVTASMLEELSFPNLTAIGGYSFYNKLPNLKRLLVPNLASLPEDGVFNGHPKLDAILVDSPMYKTVDDGSGNVSSIMVERSTGRARAAAWGGRTYVHSDEVSGIGPYVYCNAYSLDADPSWTPLLSADFPNAGEIGWECFAYQANLKYVRIPNATNFPDRAQFTNCGSSAGEFTVDFSDRTLTSIPTLALAGTTVFGGCPSNYRILVPQAMEADWKAATNWSTVADHIYGV